MDQSLYMKNDVINLDFNNMDQVKVLKEVIFKANYPIVFHPNPKYDRGDNCYFINFANVMDYNYTIDAYDGTPGYTTIGEHVVSYNSAEELVADGWRLD